LSMFGESALLALWLGQLSSFISVAIELPSPISATSRHT
jgi:hypothetical protein